MKKEQQKKLTATSVRNVLAVLLVLIIIGSATAFYFGLQIIKSYSLEVARTSADASASAESITQLSGLKQQLADGEVLVNKANKLFATPATYQSQALKDINLYASQTGVKISSIESAEPAITGTEPTNSSEIITVESPVSYASLLAFINSTEGNLPKMQITGISIERPVAVSGDQIITGKITITVSTR